MSEFLTVTVKARTDHKSFFVFHDSPGQIIKVSSFLGRQTRNTTRGILITDRMRLSWCRMQSLCTSLWVVGEAGQGASVMAAAAEALCVMLAEGRRGKCAACPSHTHKCKTFWHANLRESGSWMQCWLCHTARVSVVHNVHNRAWCCATVTIELKSGWIPVVWDWV